MQRNRMAIHNGARRVAASMLTNGKKKSRMAKSVNQGITGQDGAYLARLLLAALPPGRLRAQSDTLCGW
jgi:hypothetical protein